MQVSWNTGKHAGLINSTLASCNWLLPTVLQFSLHPLAHHLYLSWHHGFSNHSFPNILLHHHHHHRYCNVKWAVIPGKGRKTLICVQTFWWKTQCDIK